MGNPKYLIKRGKNYYFCKKINGKIIRISLKSSNLQYCKMLRDKIIESLNMNDEKEIINKILNKTNITKKEAEKIYTKEQLKEYDEQYELVKEIKLSESDKNEYLNEIFADDIKTDKKIKELEKKKENEIYNIVKELNKKLSDNDKNFTTNNNQNTNELIENIDEYFNNFLEHQKQYKQISDSSIKAYKASYRYLKYFINQDKNISLNFKTFKQIQQYFTQLPKNFFKYKKYYSKPINKILELKHIEPLNNKTINGHINNFKTFFDYLLYEEIIENNPLTNIKPLPESDEIKRLEYTKAELENIFNSNIEKEYLNICKVALYTGFRFEEILSLKKKDIKDNFIYLTLKSSSSKKHERIMPIHPNLIKTINYQKRNNKGSYLFFNGNIDNEVTNVGKRVNRKLKTIISDKNKTFHSFRKNFAQELELNTTAEEKIKKYLLGHSFNKDVTHTVYNRGKVNTDKLIECINQITFNY